jgi:hypothetical protein
VDRRKELTLIELLRPNHDPLEFRVCAVETCREFGRVYLDLRDPSVDPDEAGPAALESARPAQH